MKQEQEVGRENGRRATDQIRGQEQPGDRNLAKSNKQIEKVRVRVRVRLVWSSGLGGQTSGLYCSGARVRLAA